MSESHTSVEGPCARCDRRALLSPYKHNPGEFYDLCCKCILEMRNIKPHDNTAALKEVARRCRHCGVVTPDGLCPACARQSVESAPTVAADHLTKRTDVETRNATIKSTMLGRDHGILTCFLRLTHGDANIQSFGGYNLESRGVDFVTCILDTLEVGTWEELPGTYLRVRASRDRIEAIGHIIKDNWFTPGEEKHDAPT